MYVEKGVAIKSHAPETNSVVPAQSHTRTKHCSKDLCTLRLRIYPESMKQYKKAEQQAAKYLPSIYIYIYIYIQCIYSYMYIYKYTVLHPEALQLREHVIRHAYLSNGPE